MEETSAPPGTRPSLPRWLPGRLPRLLRNLGEPGAFVLLTFFFIFLGFPYEKLAENLLSRVQRESGVRLEIVSLSPHIGLAGPGLEVRHLKAFPAGGGPIAIDRLLLRPVWSWSWFSGAPTLYVEIDSARGGIDGRVRMGDEPGFRGSLRDVDLAALPLEDWLDGIRLAGRLAGSADLTLRDGGVEGSFRPEVSDGSLSLPSFPIALPFQQLRMSLRLGGDALVRFEQAALEGPVLDAEVVGSIAPGRGELGLTAAPIDLELRLRVRDPAARAALQGLGVRTSRDGAATIRIGGTTSAPRMR